MLMGVFLLIILASASPRRQDLLRQIACPFRSVVSHAAEENRRDIPPETLVVRNAVAKAAAVARGQAGGAAVLGADTVVVLDGCIFGKPSDKHDAVRMLCELRGKTHTVYTGIALLKDGGTWCDVERTQVTFAKMTDAEIEAYVNTGEPLDKAGAYAIQGYGAVFIERIEGCYTNVVGLPLRKLLELSRKAGIDLQ